MFRGRHVACTLGSFHVKEDLRICTMRVNGLFVLLVLVFVTPARHAVGVGVPSHGNSLHYCSGIGRPHSHCGTDAFVSLVLEGVVNRPKEFASGVEFAL